MLTPEQMAIASLQLEPIFEKFEDFVIRDLVRRLTDTGGQWTGSAEMQANYGVASGVSLNEVVASLKKTMGLADDELTKVFMEVGALNIITENERLTSAGLDPIKIEKLPFLQQIVTEIIGQTKGTLHNFSNTTAIGVVKNTVSGRRFLNLDAYYRDAIDLAMMKTRAGVTSYNEAIRSAIKEIGDEGLSVIFPSGSHCRMDVAVRRATLTGLNQMGSLQNAHIADDLELPLAEVTAHQGARPTHKIWQGKIFQIVGRSEKYENLAEATGLGTVCGLLGANCRHSWHGFAEGMPKTWTEEQLKKIDPDPFEWNGKTYDAYTASQRQRALERAIRAKKRELVGYEAAGDQEAFEKASKELKDIRKEYRAFSEKSGQRVKNERAQVLEYNRQISQKAVQAAKRYEKNQPERR